MLLNKQNFHIHFNKLLKDYVQEEVLDKMPDEKDFTREEIRRWKENILNNLDK